MRPVDTFDLCKWRCHLEVSKISMLCFGSAVRCERSWLGNGYLAWAAPTRTLCRGEQHSEQLRTGGSSGWCFWCTWRAFGPKWLLQKGGNSLEDKCSSYKSGSSCAGEGGGRCAGQLFLPISISINARSPSLSKHVWCWCLVILF